LAISEPEVGSSDALLAAAWIYGLTLCLCAPLLNTVVSFKIELLLSFILEAKL